MNFVCLEFLIKLLVIGNSGVGKSCILTRFTWDTAGQDKFRTITSSYYKGSHGIIVVYDITDRESFEKINDWMIEIEKNATENVNKILVANKCDMNEKRKVTFQEGQDLANQYNMPFFETSAKQSVNIDVIFQSIAKNSLQRLGDSIRITQMGIKLQANNNRRQSQLNKKQNNDLDIENCCN